MSQRESRSPIAKRLGIPLETRCDIAQKYIFDGVGQACLAPWIRCCQHHGQTGSICRFVFEKDHGERDVDSTRLGFGRELNRCHRLLIRPCHDVLVKRDVSNKETRQPQDNITMEIDAAHKLPSTRPARDGERAGLATAGRDGRCEFPHASRPRQHQLLNCMSRSSQGSRTDSMTSP